MCTHSEGPQFIVSSKGHFVEYNATQPLTLKKSWALLGSCSNMLLALRVNSLALHHCLSVVLHQARAVLPIQLKDQTQWNLSAANSTSITASSSFLSCSKYYLTGKWLGKTLSLAHLSPAALGASVSCCMYEFPSQGLYLLQCTATKASLAQASGEFLPLLC